MHATLPVKEAVNCARWYKYDVPSRVWILEIAYGGQTGIFLCQQAFTRQQLLRLVYSRFLLAVTTNLKVLAPLRKAKASDAPCTQACYHRAFRQHVPNETKSMQGAKTYLDGMHVYSLALLASQPQHNLLCCLSLQAAISCCSEQQ